MPKPRYQNVTCERSRHGRAIYYHRVGRGKRVRLPDGYGSTEFEAALAVAATGGTPTIDRNVPQRRAIGNALQNAIRRARQRARIKCMEFDIDIVWAIEQVEAQDLRCKLTGIPFYTATNRPRAVHPFAPSLDRIDCQCGYTKDNVQIVLFALNLMLLDWGPSVFESVAAGYRRTKSKQTYSQPSGRTSQLSELCR